MPAPKVTQVHQGTDPSISIIPVDQKGPILISPPQQGLQLLTVRLQKRTAGSQEREFLVGRGNALNPVAINWKTSFFSEKYILAYPMSASSEIDNHKLFLR